MKMMKKMKKVIKAKVIIKNLKVKAKVIVVIQVLVNKFRIRSLIIKE